jgi:coniferyl-aldehyde dehydrogenase
MRIMAGKLFNTGQVCVCPDYVFVPDDLIERLVLELQAATATLFPNIAGNPQYTSIVNDSHYGRLQHLVDDAIEKGVQVIAMNPAGENFDEQASRKMLPRLLLNPPNDSAVMQSEVFGPLLPIIGYQQVEEAIRHISEHDRPLALYYFGDDEQNRAQFTNNMAAGGIAVNDVVTQVTCHQLPFGGIGASGMGCYHGIDGFREFSHFKSVYTQTPSEEVAGFMRPPYSDAMRGMLKQQIAEG